MTTITPTTMPMPGSRCAAALFSPCNNVLSDVYHQQCLVDAALWRLLPMYHAQCLCSVGTFRHLPVLAVAMLQTATLL